VLVVASTQQPTGAVGDHAMISCPLAHCLVPQASPPVAPAVPVAPAAAELPALAAVLPPTAARPAALTELPAAELPAVLPGAAGRPLTVVAPAAGMPVAVVAMVMFSGVLLHALAKPIADTTSQTRVFIFLLA
jgi:hypothetical protein